MVQWYYAIGGQQQGPIDGEQLHRLAQSGQLRPSDLVWNPSLPNWQPARTVAGLFPNAGPPPIEAAGYDDSKRIAAAICAILLGTFGIHKFILGKTVPGLIMLLVTLLTCFVGGIVMHVIGIIEGVIYLTKSDAEFYQTYIVDGKNWF